VAVDAIADLERQLQAAASTPDPSDRAVKLRALRGRLDALLASADRLLSNAQEAREAEAAAGAVRRMEAREDADLREALGEELGEDADGLPSHRQLDELGEEGLLEEALLGRGGKALRVAFDPLRHPRGRGGQWRETPDVPAPPRRRGRAEPEVPARRRGREEPEPRRRGRGTPAEVERLAQLEPGEREARAAEPAVKTADVDEAIRLLGEGKRVELNQPRQLTLLVDKLSDMVAEAQARGEEAPDYDLCKVTVRGTNIFCAENKGVPRAQMPQLKGFPTEGSRADALPRDKRGEVDLAGHFREYLLSLGVSVETGEERADHLRASQRELNGVKVGGIARYLQSGGTIEGPPLFVSRNNYVVDGHHRWAAEVANDYADGKPDTMMRVDRIDMDILEILVEANLFASEWGLPQQAFVEEALRRALEEAIDEPWRERALRRLDSRES
jgi:hypothetical protein